MNDEQLKEVETRGGALAIEFQECRRDVLEMTMALDEDFHLPVVIAALRSVAAELEISVFAALDMQIEELCDAIDSELHEGED